MRFERFKIFFYFLNPILFSEIFNKLINKLVKFDGNISLKENLIWLEKESVNMDFFLKELNASLYLETKNLCDEINKKANIRISKIPYKLGGGGSSELLYFICRLRKPSTVLETGVATGFSTTSILHAIRKNKMGRLYSSDFPYLKIPNSIKYIGLLVEDIDKKNWSILLNGDIKNLPIFMKQINDIDIAHYDSDKSFKGREFFMNIIDKKINDDSIIIMDDIQNNSFFYEYVTRHKKKLSYTIFRYKNKFVGMIGNINLN